MIFSDPVPEDLISGAFYDQEGKPFYLDAGKLRADYSATRFQRELSVLARTVPSGSILDVGCSSGGFLFQLKKQFPNRYQGFGCDVSQPPLDFAEGRGLAIRRGSFLDFSPADARYQAITFWAVLEHLVEPRHFLKKAHDLLADGGHCFAVVPNMGSLAVRFLGARYRYILPQHVNYFTRRTLLRLCRERFEIKTITSTHFSPLVILQDMLRRQSPVTEQDRVALLQRTTRYKENPWLAPVKSAYRLTERVLGRANLADNLMIVMQKV